MPEGSGGLLGVSREELSQAESDAGRQARSARQEALGAQWTAALDLAWGPYARARAQHLEARAAERRAWAEVTRYGSHCDIRTGEVFAADVPSPAWYSARANAAREPLGDKLRNCGEQTVTAECRCGKRKVPVRCGVRWLCHDCRCKTYGRMRARTARALAAHRAAEHARWEREGHRRGRERRLTHLVLSGPHDEDARITRANVQRAWERLRKWMHQRLKRRGEPGKFHYALTWEMTHGCGTKGCMGACGNPGKGHPHAHVIALWPYEDWAAVQAEWARAMGCESSRLHLESERCTPRKASVYLAKYASKGVKLGESTPEFAALTLDMVAGRRIVSASHGFWLPQPCTCPRCKSSFRVIRRPERRLAVRRPVWEPPDRVVIVHTDLFPYDAQPP